MIAASLAASVLLLAGCFGDPSATARDLYSYDPLAAPVSNPHPLFEPFPYDPDRADTEASITRYALDQPTSLNPMFLNSWAGGFLHELLFDFLTHPNATMEAVWNEAMVVDERTFDVVHKEVSALALNNLNFSILPRHLLDDPQERAADPTMRSSPFFNRYGRDRVIGNGPYRFVGWITGDRVVVERWDDYPGEKPPIRRQIIATHSDRNAALLQFRKGILDDIWLTVQQHGSQPTAEEFRALGVKAWAPRWMHAYIGWNQDGSNPFFGDRRVRLALAHYSTTWAFSRRIRGVELSPAGIVRFWPGPRRWWVEKAQ